MEREFVTYEIALALKELWFDEECFSFYEYNGELYKSEGYYTRRYNVNEHNEVIAPTYSQAFRFFREEYGYWCYIKEATKGTCRFYIEKYDEKFFNSDIIDSYEEAELACLIKLIEIVKSK